jgi:hypothetical protein
MSGELRAMMLRPWWVSTAHLATQDEMNRAAMDRRPRGQQGRDWSRTARKTSRELDRRRRRARR